MVPQLKSRPPNHRPTDPPVTNPLVTVTPFDREPLSFSELADRISVGGYKRMLDEWAVNAKAELAERIALGGYKRSVHPSTIHRWRSRGIRGCRLAAFRIGGRWFTNLELYAEFCAAVTAAATDGESIPSPARNDERIATALAREGF